MQHNVTIKFKLSTSTEKKQKQKKNKHCMQCFILSHDKALPDTHGESVDVFVQLIQQSDRLDDHVVGSVDIKLYFGPGVTVAKTQLGLGGGKA